MLQTELKQISIIKKNLLKLNRQYVIMALFVTIALLWCFSKCKMSGTVYKCLNETVHGNDSLADWIMFKWALYALFHFASLCIAVLNEFHSAHESVTWPVSFLLKPEEFNPFGVTLQPQISPELKLPETPNMFT